MLNTTRAIIDLAALRNNFAVVRAQSPHSKILALVKADAYGHGMLPVARALHDADGFAVARLEEALQLRDAGITQRILLLGTLLDADDLRLCSAKNIDITVHDLLTAKLVAKIATQHPLRAWLKLDSGMHRLGLQPDDFRAADTQLRNRTGIIELLHLTHFSSAEDFTSTATEQQLQQFAAAHPDSQLGASLANSAALIARPHTRAQWVRPGIMLYGINPVAAHTSLPLQPVMTLSAKVLAVREIAAGEAVGYNRTWTAARTSIIATIGIGYGDGYPRHARNGTPIWINGEIAPLAGRVSMDSITVDVTDLKPVQVGDDAILWGPQLSAAQVAEYAETISYELFTAIGHRVPRLFINEQ